MLNNFKAIGRKNMKPKFKKKNGKWNTKTGLVHPEITCIFVDNDLLIRNINSDFNV